MRYSPVLEALGFASVVGIPLPFVLVLEIKRCEWHRETVAIVSRYFRLHLTRCRGRPHTAASGAPRASAGVGVARVWPSGEFAVSADGSDAMTGGHARFSGGVQGSGLPLHRDQLDELA